tara:strand:+ start:1941 stop:2459 length:519 start_codon:yes stop_codon:yes gene_type:complete
MSKLKEILIDINYWPRRKWRQIKNVIGWIPVVWKQFDFDYYYSLDVFKHQLLKQAKYMESDKAMDKDSKIDAKKIRTVVRLMDKVYNEEYACEYQQKLKDKYGAEVMDFEFLDIPEYPSMKYRYEVDEKYRSIRDEIKENSKKWFNESQDKQERAHKLLWKLIEFYIRGWWY